MRNLIFVGHSVSGACKMRGIQTSLALEKHYNIKAPYILKETFTETFSNFRDSIIVFVGEPLHIANFEMLDILQRNNNILVYDIIDNFCFSHTNISYNPTLIQHYQYLNIFIHTNSYSKSKGEELLPRAEHIIIPHQWDIDNEGLLLPNVVNTKTASYIGGLGGFQLDKNKLTGYVDVYDNTTDGNKQHSKYNIHTSFRANNTLDYYYKPCTKLAIASSFGAILLTSREESVVDIVGEAYEFYIENEDDFISKMDRIRYMSMNQIHHYRNNMKAVKEYLSPKQTAKRYVNLIQNCL